MTADTVRSLTRQRAFQVAVGLAFLGGALVLSLVSSADRSAEETSPEPTRRLVEVAEVTPAAASRSLTFSGVTRAERRAELSFTLPGRLARRPVVVGDGVRAGQELARLDVEELDYALGAARAARAEAEARLAQARRERDRVERLYGAKAATEEELEQTRTGAEALEAAVDSAGAALDEARRRRREAILNAPYAGTVTAVHAEPGEYMLPGRPVVAVAGDGEVEVEVGIPEALLGTLRPGQEVTVRLPLVTDRRAPSTTGVERPGHVTSVGRAALGSGRLFPLVVSLGAAPELTPGLTAEVVVERPMAEGLSVPLAAVLDPGGEGSSVLAVVDADRGAEVRKVPVTVLGIEEDRAVVTTLPGDAQRGSQDVGSRLSRGDRVVVAGHSGLLDGDAVEIKAPETATPEVAR